MNLHRSSVAGGTSLTTLWWLLGVATTLAMSGGSLWLTSIDGQAKRIDERSQQQAQKISRIETEQQIRWEETRRRLEQIEAKQDRVEQKIDRLLEGSHDNRRLAHNN